MTIFYTSMYPTMNDRIDKYMYKHAIYMCLYARRRYIHVYTCLRHV
jgi:hypothetical protein